jgi:hypothetical protein
MIEVKHDLLAKQEELLTAQAEMITMQARQSAVLEELVARDVEQV